MYENDFFYAETPVPDVKFHVWNIQIHTSIQQRLILFVVRDLSGAFLHLCVRCVCSPLIVTRSFSPASNLNTK